MALAPSASAAATIRSTDCSRDSASSLVYFSISPPPLKSAECANGSQLRPGRRFRFIRRGIVQINRANREGDFNPLVAKALEDALAQLVLHDELLIEFSDVKNEREVQRGIAEAGGEACRRGRLGQQPGNLGNAFLRLLKQNALDSFWLVIAAKTLRHSKS